MWSLILLATYVIYAVTAHPVSSNEERLTYEQIQRIINWKEDDQQNIWELSGQFEGDIILSEKEKNGIIGDNYLWPDKTISYMFAPEFTDAQKQTVNDALKDFTTKSCIIPKLITEGNGDYVYITGNTSGCSSNVGRKGGKQKMSLQVNTHCLSKGTIQHEFLHALGFYHQQSAMERDDYVTIHFDNILEGHSHNFDKHTSNNFGTPYDYGSVMHYSAYAFSKDGAITIETKDKNAVIGQRVGLSAIDLEKLNQMYNC